MMARYNNFLVLALILFLQETEVIRVLFSDAKETADKTEQVQNKNPNQCDNGSCSGDENKNNENVFDKFSGWVDGGMKDFFDNFMTKDDEEGQNKVKQEKKEESVNSNGDGRDQSEGPFMAMGNIVRSLMNNFGDKNNSEDYSMNLIERACKFANNMNDTRTFQETVSLFLDSFGMVKVAFEESFGHINLVRLNPLSIFYYLEHQEQVKNPTWKRRAHCFHNPFDLKNQMDKMHEKLYLSEISYVESVKEITQALNDTSDEWVLIYAKVDSVPHEPAHFIALKKEQSWLSSNLEMLMVVRGTKMMADVLSDCVLDAIDYRGGKAHAGIVASGRYLAEKHTPLFQHLLKTSGKKKVRLQMIGHSLGAGAATIAAMEFNDGDVVDATVVGFGCPSLLSPELSASLKGVVTTVIADGDVVPRMSGATVANVLLDIMAHDWTDQALQDVAELMNFVKENLPFGIQVQPTHLKKVTEFVNSTLQSVKQGIRDIPLERKDVELIPPGDCVHFYRDGRGVTARYTPCAFFNVIEVSLSMIEDHLTPTGYHRLFLDAMRGYNQDYNFKFRHDTLFG